MAEDSSVTSWVEMLKAGHDEAARKLWERYCRLLVSYARQRLVSAPKRAADEEDAALNAFDSFCRGVKNDRFPGLNDRNDLRYALLLLVARKVAHQIRDENRKKKGGGKGIHTDHEVLGQLIDHEPTPEQAVLMADEWERLLDKLRNSELRSIALWQVEGYTVDQIAEKLDRSPRTVANRLKEIRDCWNSELMPS